MRFCYYDAIIRALNFIFLMSALEALCVFQCTKLSAYFIKSSRLAQIKPVKRTSICEWVWNFKMIVQEKLFFKSSLLGGIML